MEAHGSLGGCSAIALLVGTSIVACASARPREVPQSPPVHAVASASASAPLHDDRRLVTVRTAPRILISPDDRWLVAPATLDGTEPAFVAYDLAAPSAPPRLAGVGIDGNLLRFVAGDRVLVHRPKEHESVVVSFDGAPPARFSSAFVPVASPSGATLAALDDERRVAVLDAASLAVSWSPDVHPLASTEEATIAFDGEDRIVVTQASRTRVLDRVSKRALLDVEGHEGVVWVVSRNAKFVAEAHLEGSNGWRVTVSSTDGATKTSWTERAAFPPALAFDPGETKLAIATSPSRVTLVELPSFRRRTLGTGLSFDTEGYSTFTDELAFDDDGRVVCGHPVTSIGKYTDERRTIFVDLRAKTGKKRRDERCYVSGGRAFVVTLPPDVERDGRQALVTTSATYTHVSNELISPDGRVVGVVAARLSPDRQTWVDAEMTLVDRATGKSFLRLPVGEGPAGMGEMLISWFSPRGKWLAVSFGEQPTRLFDAHDGARVGLPPNVDAANVVYSPGETFAIAGDARRADVLALPNGEVRGSAGIAEIWCLRGGALFAKDACGAP